MARSGWTVRARLIVMTAVVAVACAVGGSLQYRSLSRIAGLWREYSSTTLERERLISRMKSELGYGGAIHHYLSYILRGDSGDLVGADADLIAFKNLADNYRALPDVTELELRYLATLEQTIERYHSAVFEARDLLAQGWSPVEVDTALRIDDQSAIAAFDLLMDGTHGRSSESTRRIQTALRQTTLSLTGSLAAVFLALAITTLLIVLSIRRGLSRVLRATGAVADGDLTVTTGLESGDEIGRIAGNVDRAMMSIRGMIGEVERATADGQSVTESLLSGAEETSSAVSSITESLQEIRRQFAALAQAVGNSNKGVQAILSRLAALVDQIGAQAAAVEETSSAVTEMSASVDSMARITQERKATAEQLAVLTAEGGTQIRHTTEIMSSVAQGADRMVAAVRVINDIAAQTNLLAMNAAIEAAHAGKAGSGFAVVAGEIRKLASSTAENAKTISETLSEVAERIKEGRAASQASGEAFQRVASDVRNLVEAFVEIASSNTELASGSREIVKTSTDLLGITESIRDGSGEIQSETDSIGASVRELEKAAETTGVRVEEIGSGARTIEGAVQRIVELSRANAANFRKISDGIAAFRR